MAVAVLFKLSLPWFLQEAYSKGTGKPYEYPREQDDRMFNVYVQNTVCMIYMYTEWFPMISYTFK